MLAKEECERAPSPVSEHEAAHLGDARAGPRTLPLLPAAAGGTKEHWKALIQLHFA